MKVGLDASVLVASVKRTGEKYYEDALGLAKKMTTSEHEGICSALFLIEIPGALASSTTMPLEKIYDVELSLIKGFRINVRPFELHADRAVDLMLEFRDLKGKFGIGSADFHYLATASGEGCDFFVTTDEKHLLKRECRERFSKYIPIHAPSEALRQLSS